MSVYVEIKSDAELLELVRPFGTILIVTCQSCTNVSVAYDTETTLASRDFAAGLTSWHASAALELATRIRRLLERAGQAVLLQQDRPCMLSTQRTDVDAILSLACAAGSVGIAKTIGAATPVLVGALTSSLLQYHVDITEERQSIDISRSTLVRFSQPIESIGVPTSYWEIVNAKSGP